MLDETEKSVKEPWKTGKGYVSPSFDHDVDDLREELKLRKVTK